MIRNWTQVGAKYNGTVEQQAKLSEIFDSLDWKKIIPGELIPAMPGMLIKESIEQLSIPKPSRYAISRKLAPLGLVAVEGNYKNGRAFAYILDEGDTSIVLCSDFYPN